MPTKEEIDKFFASCKPSWVNKEMPDLSKDPTVIRRAREAEELLKKIGIPEEIRIAAGLPENWRDNV
jgi:hypothetical protein